MKIVWMVSPPRQEGEKGFWTRIGVAFVNRDGSINVKLDAIPLDRDATIQIRDHEPREDSAPGPRQQRDNGQRQGARPPSRGPSR